ncbi:hypothetical protein THAOC_28460 [Thalassiosira oceanica]|uniref:Terpene cyclase/mutase family member n=1 Tax=Thalassiosira oceanica TaxID=159749 RepID=K0RJ27_THAOC|nr:hypothetical protein THAOC_28460 [Thalassiosira oceanica]|eukprot:EJK52279.1 hypothetical protein THAOC_28460 [Thalassiosira oceanica]
MASPIRPMSSCIASALPRFNSCQASRADFEIPVSLRSLFNNDNGAFLSLSPLLLLAVATLLCSLLAAQYLSRTPISQLGHVGHRGRVHFSFKERTTGSGSRLVDWFLYGGCVWIRALQCVWDHMAGGRMHNAGDEMAVSQGENLFACMGVAKDATLGIGNEHAAAPTSKKPQETNTLTGILGYDSSLGSLGPLVLAPMRASCFLLIWLAASDFLVSTHRELTTWIASTDRSVGLVVSAASFFIDRTEQVMKIGSAVESFAETSMGDSIFLKTAAYSIVFVLLGEIKFYVLGMVCSFFKIYVPRGVSHPGGPRPHKIARMPKWTGGKDHYLPEDALKANWRCAVAHDAHRATLTNPIGPAKLSGEPFGRQIWTTVPNRSSDGLIETEDDLEMKLRDEFGVKSMNGNKPETSKKNREQTKIADQNIFSPILGFVQGILPNSDNNEKPGQSNDKEMSHMKVLVESLASGGRTPMAFDPSKNPNSCDQPFRSQMITQFLEKNGGRLPEELSYLHDENGTVPKPTCAIDAAKRGVAFYSMLQTTDGHWAGDYGGPHFLLPGLVVAWYILGRPSNMISAEHGALMLHYLRVHQQEDGGWGTHIESPSTMFGTTMIYLAVRLLGGNKHDEWVKRGREFIKNEGGAIMTSSWAKFWLCLVGCMDWKGHNSVPPEMWLLPNWFPFHPGRLWCHCRMVYLPMGYLYGYRFVYSDAETDPLIAELREELYCEHYDSIQWESTRHLVAEMDNYSPIPAFMIFAQNILSLYENWSIFRPFRDAVRKKGLTFCAEYMKAEDQQTNFIDIGPVNKALNLVAAFHAAGSDVNHQAVQSHIMRVPDYLWVAEDGMKAQGYNGSQCWDTSFAIQAIWECKLLDHFPLLSSKVWAYLERSQILSTETSKASPAYQYETPTSRERFYRHVSKGGWPFSTSAHGWPISDCTGEGLKGVLALMDSPVVMAAVGKGVLKSIEPSRIHDAVNVMLTLQNEDGGWATYENNRGFGWYEELNPSEVFGDIMIDYSYVECSMASLTALAEFHEKFPCHRSDEIKLSICRGKEFMKSIQREDGSWYGSWACCFCYGCWFGIEGLTKAGESHSSATIRKCCQFLLSKQRPNGGWGEDFTSCYDKDYARKGMECYGDEGSGVVSTAWALLALSAAKCDDVNAVRRGVQYLIDRQLDCGDWPQEGISGVFNRACGITYTAYRNVFPIWALGRCSSVYGSSLVQPGAEDK